MSSARHPHPKRLSRRQVMKAAGIAPMMALASRAWAQPSEENMEAVRAMAAGLPPAEVATIRQKATAGGCQDVDKLELVARALWTHFSLGRGKVPLESGFQWSVHAYDFKTGAKIVQAINEGNFDPFGNDQLTNICAYVCGHKAATLAISEDAENPEIKPADYNAAWNETESEMTNKLKTARGGAPLPKSGYGC